MLLFAFSLVSANPIIEMYGESDIQRYLSMPNYSVVKFYRTGCVACMAIKDDFEKASTFFDTVPFYQMDCVVHEHVCDKYDVKTIPYVVVYTPANLSFVFDGDTCADGFANFIQDKSGIKPKRPKPYMDEIIPSLIPYYKEAVDCLFISYYQPKLKESNDVMPNIHKAASAFRHEKKVLMATVNCFRYSKFCNEYDFPIYPYVNVSLKNGSVFHHRGSVTPQSYINYINEKCGTSRTAEGFLNENVGLIEEAQSLIKVFETNPQEALNKAKEIPGAENYVEAMNLIIEKGMDVFKEATVKVEDILYLPEVDDDAFDNANIKFNVYSQFQNINYNGKEL